MQAFKFVRNVVATCVALLAMIVPAAKAKASVVVPRSSNSRRRTEMLFKRSLLK